MISVAMTTYNGEKYIEKQLLSLLKQTKKPDEVIIVDDCSTDSTVKLVTEFIHNNALALSWKLIILPTNGGFIQSFYTSILETNGDIIFLCDQDDIWLPNKIEMMSDLMLANSNILSLASGFTKIDANDQEIISKNNPFSSNNNLIRKRMQPNSCVKISPFRVVAYNISPGCTYAFRSSIKEVFSILNGEDTNLVHDWKINLIASVMDGLYFLNTPTILYRLHQNNSLGMSREITIASRIQACQKSAVERKLMQNILEEIIDDYDVLDSSRNREVHKYIKKLRESQLKREKTLQKRNILSSFYLLFKYNLFKNRVYESLVIDILAIIKSYKSS